MNEQIVTKATSLGDSKDAAWDVFLSYAAEDAEWVRSFEAKLTSQGLKVFDLYATPTAYWGNSRDEVVAAIYPSKCPIAFVVLSAAYSRSEHSRELASFLQATKANAGSLILPVRLDDSPIPESIQSVAILDASAQSPAQVAEEVAAKLKEWLLVTRPGLPDRTDDVSRDDLIRTLVANAEKETSRLRVLFPEVDAEEVVQEAIVDLMKNLHRRPEFGLLPYFRTFVRRRAMDMIKMKSRAQQSREFLPQIAEREAAVDPVIEQEHLDQIRHAMELLTPMDRMIINSHYMDGLTSDQMAKEMGLSPSTLRIRLHRAITKLRTMLQNET